MLLGEVCVPEARVAVRTCLLSRSAEVCSLFIPSFTGPPRTCCARGLAPPACRCVDSGQPCRWGSQAPIIGVSAVCG